MTEYYEMQTRLDFVDNYDNYISSKELAKQGKLRVLLSNFLEVYFKNPIEMNDILERGSVTPDAYAQQMIEESRLKAIKEITLRQAFIDSSLQEVENNNGKLLEYIDSNKFKEFRDKLSVDETEELVENNSSLNKEDVKLLEELDLIKTQLNSINYRLNNNEPSTENIQNEVNDIESVLTQSIDDVFKRRMESMEENIANKILQSLSTNNVDIKPTPIINETPKVEEIVEVQEVKEEIIETKPVQEINNNNDVVLSSAMDVLSNLGISSEDEELEDVEPIKPSSSQLEQSSEESVQEKETNSIPYTESVQSTPQSEQVDDNTSVLEQTDEAIATLDNMLNNLGMDT